MTKLSIQRACSSCSSPDLPYISPISPQYLPNISPISPLYLPYISRLLVVVLGQEDPRAAGGRDLKTQTLAQVRLAGEGQG